MGNPPYSVSSSNKTDFIENLMETYKTAVRSERNIQPLSDDYIKFIRFAHWKMEKVKKGAVGIITNNSYIDGLIHRGMREELAKTFDEIYILNLHGNSNKSEKCLDGSKDENVFDIKQGVSIAFFVKTGKKTNDKSGVYYYSLQGLRNFKYDFLYEKSIQNSEWAKVETKAPDYWYLSKNMEMEEIYNRGWKISDIFMEYDMGVATHNDEEFVYFEKKGFKDERSYNYRPFDYRIINYDLKKIGRPRYTLMRNLYVNNNFALVTTKINRQISINYFFITNMVTDRHILDSASDSTSIFPFYIYPDEMELSREKQINFTPEFMKFAENYIKDISLSDGWAETIFSYIYAVLFSPAYRKKYHEFLKIDFPRVPFMEEKELFRKLAGEGQKLIDLHLLKTEFESLTASFPVENPDLKVESVKYEGGKVWINKTTYFDGVPELAWNYLIGGYQVLDKWLKSRKGRVLTGEEINYFLRVCEVLLETIGIQEKIDVLTREWI